MFHGVGWWSHRQTPAGRTVTLLLCIFLVARLVGCGGAFDKLRLSGV